MRLKLREEPAEPALKREAERAGLDWARLKRDMDDPSVQRRIDANAQLAQALRIEELTPGGVERADALFHSALHPWCPEIF
jgi:hypothetical protein